MSLNVIENLGNPNAAQGNSPTARQQESIRQAAVQFEAILLLQLTSALSGTSDDEDALFGGDSGTTMAKQMFSEQLASTMADAGGIGLSDLIMRQFGLNQPKTAGVTNQTASVVPTVKDIIEKGSSNVAVKNNSTSLINKNGKVEKVTDTFTGDPNEFAVVSTFEEDAKLYGVDDATRALEFNGKILNSTRPRIVPNKPVNEINPVSASTNPTVSTNSTVSTNTNSETVNYQMPVTGRISSNFGNRMHPIDKVIKFHAGMDIAAPTGTPIGAAADGVVTFSGWRKGYGNLVIIRHADGRETRYGHASKLFVKEGESVVAGQKIAAVGSTGKSTGPHLHFEVRENGQAVNPQKFIANVLPK